LLTFYLCRVDPDGPVPRPAFVPYLLWLVVYTLFLMPFSVIAGALSWFFVISIPMGKIQFKLMKLLFLRSLFPLRYSTFPFATQHFI